MPDLPESAITAAAEVMCALHDLDPQWAETLARAALEAAAPILAEAVAQKITAHMESHGPRPGSRVGGKAADDTARRTWRRYLGTAARVAAGAFDTREDQLRMAAGAIKRGDFIACNPPEVPGA